jgi:hypothetical protein
MSTVCGSFASTQTTVPLAGKTHPEPPLRPHLHVVQNGWTHSSQQLADASAHSVSLAVY